MAPAFLSKSRYLNGLQCLKYLWLQVNQPSAVPKPDARTQHLFDQGHLVQQYAERLFPDGVRVPESSFRGSIEHTLKMLKGGKPFFEAGILADDVYSRIDVFRPAGNGSWDIIEVKSSTKVKDENIHDVSFQKYCCEKRGLSINKCFLVHINNRYIKDGDIDPQRLFTMSDISTEVEEAAAGIEDRINTMLEVMRSSIPPDGRVDTRCSSPYECPVTICRDALPDNNILHLYRGAGKGFDLLYQGICYLRDIPDAVKLSEPQQRQKWCDANSSAYVDGAEIKKFLTSLKYPVHYLDFETFSTAIPLLDGTRPYQQVPFQFSLHTVDKPGSIPWPFGFLAEGPEDPRPEFIRQLQLDIGKKGSIVVYNQSFEQGILNELAEAFPEHKDWVDGVCDRMVDLLVPFRGFSYYHPAQKGSASIKAVMPAVTGRGYDGLDIAVGDEASLAYLDMTYGNMSDEEKTKTRADLEIYCGRDTEGMVWIVDALKRLSV